MFSFDMVELLNVCFDKAGSSKFIFQLVSVGNGRSKINLFDKHIYLVGSSDSKWE